MGSQSIPLGNLQSQNASQHDQAVSGADYMQKLLMKRAELDKAIVETTKKAVAPTSSGTVPTNANVSGPHQWENIQPDRRESYSSKGAQAKSIGNVITGVANLVGSYAAKRKNDQLKTLSVDIERVMTAKTGIDEARQTLAQDPQNKEAQAVIEKNGNIINAVMSDPKKAKQIEKAFDLSFTDPEHNKTPEHGAMKEAAKSYAQQFEEKLPSRMTPNQQAQGQLQIQESQSKALDSEIKSISGYDQTVMRTQASAANLEEKRLNDQAKQQEEQAKLDQKNQELKQKDKEFEEKRVDNRQRALLVSDTSLRRANISAVAGLTRTEKLINGRAELAGKMGLTGKNNVKFLQSNLTIYNNQLSKLDDEINKNIANRDANGVQDKTPYDNNINWLESEKKNLADNISKTQSELSLATDLAEEDTNGSSSPKSTSASSSSSKPANTKPAVKKPESDHTEALSKIFDKLDSQ